MSNLAFIGLGVIGFPMAGHLAKAGHTVTVYNRSSNKAKKFTMIPILPSLAEHNL